MSESQLIVLFNIQEPVIWTPSNIQMLVKTIHSKGLLLHLNTKILRLKLLALKHPLNTKYNGMYFCCIFVNQPNNLLSKNKRIAPENAPKIDLFLL